MYCSKCGKEINDEAVVCVHCGCAVNGKTNCVANDDAPSAGWTVLGFFFPLIGLIYYLICKDTYPQKSKSAGKGALIGFCVGLVLGIVSAIIGGIMLGSFLDYFLR